MKGRLPAFVTVGTFGFLLQVGSLWVLTSILGWRYETATAVAVQLAVIHNYFWHERWTWRDRVARDRSWSRFADRFGRYTLTTGVTSIVGNVLSTAMFVEIFGAEVLVANVLAVMLMSASNFLMADQWVFARRIVIAGALATATAIPASAAELKPETLAAWNRYVRDTESRLQDPQRPMTVRINEPEGETHGVPGGRIHRWRAATLVRGTTVEAMVSALMNPGTPPPQDDVLEARVLQRSNNSLKVYLKLVRRTIMTVTYHTEHEMTFERHGPGLASSRSVATRIAETDGRDRGFLWKLNSYWRYVQVGDAVRVELQSVSLSREVPVVLKPVAGPVISRIARESVINTLTALRDYFADRGTAASQTVRRLG